MRWTRLILLPEVWALTSLGVFLTGCCEDEGPCFPWVHQGETYTVELVQHVEVKNDTDVDGPDLFDNYRSGSEPCGPDLDLAVGAVARIKADGNSLGGEDPTCHCSYVKARATVPNVKYIRDRDGGISNGNWMFASLSDVRIRGKCDAIYTIGLAPISQDFINRSGQDVATNYILFRDITFGADEAAACGHDPIEHRTCWDNWAVRIQDRSGTVVTTDIAPTHRDSGAEDDSGA